MKRCADRFLGQEVLAFLHGEEGEQLEGDLVDYDDIGFLLKHTLSGTHTFVPWTAISGLQRDDR